VLEMDKKIITTIDEYISSFPQNVQKILRVIKRSIRETAPEAEEAISYQIPTFKLNGNLVHFAAFKNHIGFYPGSKAINMFKKEIASYKSSKGAIQFPIDKAMPLTLIKKIVRYRVKESSSMVKKKR
jgi:uncharacterized protein YdhG (YjbR/CyaY superfamily)